MGEEGKGEGIVLKGVTRTKAHKSMEPRRKTARTIFKFLWYLFSVKENRTIISCCHKGVNLFEEKLKTKREGSSNFLVIFLFTGSSFRFSKEVSYILPKTITLK